MSERKTGAYLCSGCGIGEAVSMDELAGVAKKEFRVDHCQTHECLCGDAGVEMIKADLAAGTVTDMVIGACSPRVMTDRFNFPGAQVLRANFREQVAWCQPAGDENTQMLAADNLRMALTQIKKGKLPEPYTEGEFSTRILVVGGGVGGLSAALEASKAGYQVLLVERSDRLGGFAAKLTKRMPHHPPYTAIEDNDVPAMVKAVEGDSRIEVRLDTMVTKTAGMPGRFTVSLTKAGTTDEVMIGAIVMATGWRPYDATKLGHLGYGASPDVVTNVEFEAMLGSGALARKSDGKAPKAIAFIQCAGSRDPDHLPYCSSICCGVSIKQALQVRDANPDTMLYIVYQEMRTPGIGEDFYRTGQDNGIVFIKGKVKGVGKDLTVTVDDALLGEEVPLGGLDMVVLATGMVPNATNVDLPGDAEKPFPPADINPLSAIPVAGYAGAEPDPIAARADVVPEGGSILNLQYRQGPHLPNLADGFADSHFICFPYETRRTGIYTCGPVRRPMDIAETAEDAAGAVMKAIQAVENARGGRAVHPRSGDLSYPKINLNNCTQCRRCTVECPFGAIDETDKNYPIVNPSRCRRCGTCMGACPVRVISFDNYSVEMISSMIKAVEIPDEFEEKPRVLVLACQNDAYPALDMAGINGHKYSPFVRVVPVRCLGSVSILFISDALSAGYDGVMLLGCKSGDDYQCHFTRGSLLAKERMSKIGETLKSMQLEPERVQTYEIAISDAKHVTQVIDDFMAKIDEIGLNPFKGF